jgi:peptide/nickel transport system permease protein
MVRLTRGVTLGLASEELVLAARARGERAWYILGAEILPNAWPPIIVESALRVTFAIMLGAALSFLGLGVQPPASDWGLMIAEARPFIDSAPWVALAPGIALCITVIAVNLVGDGLRELLDPRLVRGRG